MLSVGFIAALSIVFPPRPWGVTAVALAAPTLFWSMWKCVQRIARLRRARDQAHPPPQELPSSSTGPQRVERERRRVPRRTGAVTPIHMRDAISPDDELAYVLDRSTAGLRLSVRRALIIGLPIRLRAPNAPADSPWVDATVRWCGRSKDKFEVGCEFARTPPWNLLLMFG